jgi:TonB family protein
MPQGHYFAWILSSYLDQHGNNKFAIANHIDFDKELTNRNIRSSTLVPGQALQSAAPDLGADVLLTGTIEQLGDSYLLQVTPINVRDGKSLSTISQSIKMTDFMESFVTPFPPNILDASGKGGSPSIAMPSCIRCPNPSYNDLARKNKVNGSCVLNVLISESGEPQQIRPTKLLGYGLDERAFDIIKTWKFRPATLNRNGIPVAVIVPIEVTFRIY